MWVVKLGGSLFHSDHLRVWLEVLAEAGPLVIVPGGGPFADQVRLAQRQWGFDDSSSHLMALLAMEQYGRMLCALQPGLAAAASRSQIDEVVERGEIFVWMPSAMVMNDSEIEQCWDVTSDSLAAWLSGQLGVASLLLVKSVSLGLESQTLQQLVDIEVIDARFGGYLQRSGAQAWIMASHEANRFEVLYQGNQEVATRIVATSDEEID